MLCPQCGTEVGDTVRLCDSCRSRMDARPEETVTPVVDLVDADSQGEETPPNSAAPSEPPPPYAGFWLRFFAWCIDSSILSVASLIIGWIFLAVLSLSLQDLLKELVASSAEGVLGIVLAMCTGAIYFALLSALVGLLYFALMESSKYQGTLGKLAFSLVVTDVERGRISTKQAAVRHIFKHLYILVPLMLAASGVLFAFALSMPSVAMGAILGSLIVSVLLFLYGYSLAGLSKRKQALHDMLAQCLVLKKAELDPGRKYGTAALALVLFFFLRPEGASDSGRTRPRPTRPSKITSVPSTTAALPVMETVVTTTTLPAPPVEESAAGHLIAGKHTAVLQGAAALLFPQQGRLEVGFYLSPPTEEELESARLNMGFDLVSPTGPLVVAHFALPKTAERCVVEQLQNYSLVVVRRSPLSFPGSSESLSFVRNSWWDNRSQIPEFSCKLAGGEQLLLRLKESGLMEGGSLFSWSLRADTTIIDVTKHRPKTKEAKSAPDAAVDLPLNQVKAGPAEAAMQSAVGLLHTRYKRLEIAFFSSTLSPEQISSVAGKRSLRTAIPGLTPEVIIGIKFTDEATVAAKKEIEEYFITFFRDSVGSFYFGGQRDFINFDRIGTDRPGEAIDISGPLADGAKIAISAGGKDRNSHGTPIPFSWNLKMNAPIFAVDF